MRLLITGSEGFIGGEAFRRFTTLDWDLRTLDRVPSAVSEDHWVVDLSSEGVPDGLFIGVDMILHLAHKFRFLHPSRILSTTKTSTSGGPSILSMVR